MAEVERWWFRTKAAGLTLPDLYCPMRTRTVTSTTSRMPMSSRTSQRSEAECLAADEAVREMSLDDTFAGRNGPISLRWVYVHMIEEYARHNGHADLLRECIDEPGHRRH